MPSIPVIKIGGTEYVVKDYRSEPIMNSFVGDMEWYDGQYWSNANGALVNGTSYIGSKKYYGNDAFALLNMSQDEYYNIVLFWKGSTFVGSWFRGKYINPSQTQVTSLDYDIFAVDRYPNFGKEVRIMRSINDLERPLSALVSDFNWRRGYYHMTTAEITGFGTSYHCTQKIYEDHISFEGDLDVFSGGAANFLSFWKNGIYAGYQHQRKYHTPDGVEVDSIDYDAWAFNCGYGTFGQYKHKSIDYRIQQMEHGNWERFSHLLNKKIGFLGDSITAGVGASDPTATSYVALMNGEFETVINYGINGSLIADEVGRTSNSPMCTRYSDMADDLDIIVVFGGTNDNRVGTKWGTAGSTDITTFLGALNVLMTGLVQKYCGKEIFFVTPMSSVYGGYNTDDANQCGKTLLDYRNAIIERAAYHGIPVIDLYSMCNMDVAHNAANKSYYSSDGVHPNDAGHKRIHDRIVTSIANMIC